MFGGIFTLAAAWAFGLLVFSNVPAPPEIVLAVGAVFESTAIFFLLLVHHAQPTEFLIMGGLAIVLSVMFRRRLGLNPVKLPRAIKIAAAVIFGAYGIWYFVNALAPEVLSDGVAYHLGLPSTYLYLGRFPARVTFYDVFPQGMEMLYLVAFAFGRHSAAKLVEFGFFLATLPLIFRICRRLGMNELAALTAAVFYFCAPIVAITGSSSYNDAAQVFFALASLYLLIVWRDTEECRYLLPAGLLAGFCCAIKLSGAFTLAAAILFVLLRRRVAASAIVAAGGVLAIAPWLARNTFLTGNPFAPFLNRLFPNPWFHVETERQLSAALGSFGSIKPLQVPWQLAFGNELQGSFGPLLLVLPIGLWALRRPSGRLLWAAAVLLACPWYFNTGARFLMPSIACAAMALGLSLPRPAAWTAIILQAVLCWPGVIDWRERRHSWRLDEFPIAAALRIVPEPKYIQERVEAYSLAQLVERETPPKSRTLAFAPVADAYSNRDIRVWWQSADGDRMSEALRAAAFSSEGRLLEWKAEWPIEAFDHLKITVPATDVAEFDIADVSLYSGKEQVHSSTGWRIRAWPNQWEAPLALDGNLVTHWRSRQPVKTGMYFQIEFDHPTRISSASVFSQASRPGGIEFSGAGPGSRLHRLNMATSVPLPLEHLRIEAAIALRNAGYQYLLVPTGGGGYAPLGNAITGQEDAWGLVPAGYAGRFRLFRIK